MRDGQPRFIVELLAVVSLVSACADPGASSEVADKGVTELVPCSAEYTSRHHNADNTSTVTTRIYASLQVDLQASDGWRVTAMACDQIQDPPPAPCPLGDTCEAPPAARCVGRQPLVTDDSTAYVDCGTRIEHRGPIDELLSKTTDKYLSVTFHVQ